jgi:hypothetical protein
MRIFRIALVGACLVALSLSACGTGSERTVGAPTPRAAIKVVDKDTPAPEHVIVHRLSAHTMRVLNRNGLMTTEVDKKTRPRISEKAVLSHGTPRERKLVTEIELVRMTNANSGPIDSAGVVHPSMRDRLVWVVITRDPYPFVSGPITATPRPRPTGPSHTSYLWNAVDAQTGKFLQAETFESSE